MDQQQVDKGQLQLDQALVDDALEIVGHQVALAHFCADEHLVARDAGGAQALAVFHLVAVILGGVEMAVADLQGGLDRLHADVAFQSHGAEADLRDAGAMRFDDGGFDGLHDDLLALRMVCGGGRGKNARSAGRCQPGGCGRASRGRQDNPRSRRFLPGRPTRQYFAAHAFSPPSYIGINQD